MKAKAINVDVNGILTNRTERPGVTEDFVTDLERYSFSDVPESPMIFSGFGTWIGWSACSAQLYELHEDELKIYLGDIAHPEGGYLPEAVDLRSVLESAVR